MNWLKKLLDWGKSTSINDGFEEAFRKQFPRTEHGEWEYRYRHTCGGESKPMWLGVGPCVKCGADYEQSEWSRVTVRQNKVIEDPYSAYGFRYELEVKQ